MKKKKIGLFGFGCVGQGLYNILRDQDSKAEIIKIAVKDKLKKREADAGLFVYDADDILNDDQIDIIVELIDDPSAAFDVVKRALSKKIPVVSANKKMIAENLEVLIGLQKQYDTPLLYEGAVCGSIPVLQSLENYYSFDIIKSISGIFNGSSNYILSKIFNDRLNYHNALKQAQELGFAETDPTLDVGGFDPKFKLSILTQHAFGKYVNPELAVNLGIDQIRQSDIDFALENELKIKLVASASNHDEQLSLLVAPQFVNKNDRLYSVEDENNAVIIDSAFAGEQVLIGKGAGSLPTGLAVYADLENIISGIDYDHPNPETVLELPDEFIDIYIQYKESHFVTSVMSEIYEQFVGKEKSYAIGKISLQKLKTIIHLEDISLLTLSANAKVQLVTKLTYNYV